MPLLVASVLLSLLLASGVCLRSCYFSRGQRTTLHAAKDGTNPSAALTLLGFRLCLSVLVIHRWVEQKKKFTEEEAKVMQNVRFMPPAITLACHVLRSPRTADPGVTACSHGTQAVVSACRC